MKIANTITASIRLAASLVGDSLRVAQTHRECWSYLGGFGDDFFGDDD
jgi:hypothetical protein